MTRKTYSTYKDSGIDWLGPVPSHWAVVPGKRYLTHRKEIVGDRHDQFNRLSLTMDGVLPRSKESRDGLSPESFSTYQILRNGQLVFKMIDLENLATSRVGISNDEGLVSSAYIVTSTAQGLHAKYAYWYYMSLYVQGIYNVLGSGVRSTLNADDVLSIPITKPTLAEQHLIAGYLDYETSEIDTFISDQQNLIELLNERRKSALQSVAEYASGVPTVRLRYLYRQSREANRTDLEVLSVYRDFGVIPKSSRTDNLNKTPEDVSRYLVVQPGYLVINKMKAWQGSLGVSAHEGIVSPDYEVLVPISSALSAQYVHHMLRSPEFVANYAVRSVGIRPSQWRLYWDQMKDIAIPVPDMVTQQRFVHDLNRETTEIDAAIADAREAIALSKERRAAVISAAVTGKIDVRNWTPKKQAETNQGEPVGVAQ